MSIFELFMLGLGLGADAFAVAVGKGLSLKEMKWKFALITGLYFGIFQAIMPFLGYLSGIKFGGFISKYSGLVTFLLLLIIGINMIREVFKEENVDNSSFSFLTMIFLAIATSIDAYAVGITFSFIDINIYLAMSIIGIITFILSFVGVKIGNTFGVKYGKCAQLFGGIILILIGIKSLFEQIGIF